MLRPNRKGNQGPIGDKIELKRWQVGHFGSWRTNHMRRRPPQRGRTLGLETPTSSVQIWPRSIQDSGWIDRPCCIVVIVFQTAKQSESATLPMAVGSLPSS